MIVTTESVAAQPDRAAWRDRLRAAAGRVLRVGRAAPGVVAGAVGRGWQLTAQLAGGGAALVGFYQKVGLEWTLMVGGVALLAVGTLAELAGKAKAGS